MTYCIFLMNYRVQNSGGGPVDISLEEDHNDYVGLKHQLEDVENRVCTVRKKFMPEEIGIACAVHVIEVQTGKINAVKWSYKFFVFLVGSIPTLGELGPQHGQHGQLVWGRQLHDG